MVTAVCLTLALKETTFGNPEAAVTSSGNTTKKAVTIIVIMTNTGSSLLDLFGMMIPFIPYKRI